jgi:2,4'-dihydroxyacetophenone dioxygenase
MIHRKIIVRLFWLLSAIATTSVNGFVTTTTKSSTQVVLPSRIHRLCASTMDTLSSEDQGEETRDEQSKKADGEQERATTDDAYTPYQGEQPKEALSEIFVPQVFGHSLESGEQLDDERLWVPQTDTVSFRPLCFCVSGGYYVNLLRVKGAGLLSRHRHPGPVHGHVLKGKWSYLEHDWVAETGSYVFEPPGEIHTLVVPEGVEEMVSELYDTNIRGTSKYEAKRNEAKRTRLHNHLYSTHAHSLAHSLLLTLFFPFSPDVSR